MLDHGAWLHHLAGYDGLMGSRNNLSPLDIYSKGPPVRRRSFTALDHCEVIHGQPNDKSSEPSKKTLQEILLQEPAAVGTQPEPGISSTDEAAESDDGLAPSDESSDEDKPVILTVHSNSNPITAHTPSDVPKPLTYRGVRRNSQNLYAEKLHTYLLLDWDDTIFPTTWVRRDCGMNWRLSLDAQLEPGPRMTLISTLLDKLLERAVEFFEEAVQHANIFIVTLARRPWVEVSLQNFLPKLGETLHKMNLKVIYAQEYVDENMAQELMQDTFQSMEESKCFWTRVKREAIARELEDIHRRNDASWKNILSLGDSDFERYGTICAGEEYMRREMKGSQVLRTGVTPDGYAHTSEGVSMDGHLKRLRTKTVKMLSEPTIEELTAELALLKSWLPHMVQKDSGFDIELDCTDDNERLRDLHRQVTGEYEELTWEELAGMK
eukprot:CAMPEP_0171061762 /NCGR_PEP_ID=MMETSP0766_2-20121228/4648_1 /TAXON_ID=439317 /ORGANISM="Gambierdiscus australes, Strain CAWD 149" /LENGTH=436 /DNA_ID=CAMNT_0011517489 /DNA_START=3 /DNA_END=1313 /DNA_ORIENTATION=-